MPRLSTHRLVAAVAALGLVPLALIGAVAPAQAVVPNPTWPSQTNLGSTFTGDPLVFMSADGTHSLVLAENDEIGVSTSSNGGAWSTITGIGSSENATEWAAAASLDAQTVAVAYEDADNTYSGYALVSTDGGTTWGDEALLNIQPTCEVEDERPAVSVSPGGRVIAVAFTYANCTQDAIARFSTDGGQTWGAEEVLPQSDAMLDPKIRVLDDGRAIITWRDDSYSSAYAATRTAAGVWSSAFHLDLEITTRNTFEVSLDVSPDGSRVATAWSERTTAYVRMGTWSGNTVTWDPPVELTAAIPGLANPNVIQAMAVETSVKGATVAARFDVQMVAAGPEVDYIVASTDGGQTFTLSPAMGTEAFGDALVLSDSGKVVHTAWGSPNVDGKGYTMTSLDGGQTWSTKAQLSTADGRAPAIAANSSGAQVVGAWPGNVTDYDLHVTGGTVALSAPPGAPATSSAVMSGGTMTVTWTTPSSPGAGTISHYYVVVVGGGSCTVNATTFTCTVTGLNVSVTYTVIIYVLSQYGYSSGLLEESEVVAGTPPSKPRTPTAVAGNASVVVSWLVPSSNGGQPITSYLVTSTPGSKTCTATAPSTSCTVSALTNGTSYTFSVVAVNLVGPSGAATTSAVTPVAGRKPGAPTVKAVPKDKALLVTVTKPADHGSSAITEYRVVAKPSGKSCTITPSGAGPYTCEITGLVNGENNTLEATAKNSVGVGAKGTAGPFSAAAKPGAPRNLAIASRSTGVLKLEWDAPASNGGRAIQGYVVFYRLESGTKLTELPMATGLKRTLSDLKPGARYRVSVAAKNAMGRGPTVFLANVRVPN